MKPGPGVMLYSFNSAAITDTNTYQFLESLTTSGQSWFVTQISASNLDATVNTALKLLAGTDDLWSVGLAKLGGSANVKFDPPIQVGEFTALNAKATVTSAEVTLAIAAFIGRLDV